MNAPLIPNLVPATDLPSPADMSDEQRLARIAAEVEAFEAEQEPGFENGTEVPDGTAWPGGSGRTLYKAALDSAIAGVGSAAALARQLGITPQALSQWQLVPPTRVVEVERICGVPRHVLRPDLYAAPAIDGTAVIEVPKNTQTKGAEPRDGSLDWWTQVRAEGCVAIDEQPETAVYRNTNNGVVIRQPRDHDDEDAFVFFAEHNVPALIRALARNVGLEVDLRRSKEGRS